MNYIAETVLCFIIEIHRFLLSLLGAIRIVLVYVC